MATVKDSQRQERTLAKQLQGSVNAGSGNGWVRKGDVRSDTELWECKVTSAKSYSLKQADLEKLNNQALLDGRMPVFLIEFMKTGDSFVVLSKDDFMELRGKIFGDETQNSLSQMVQ